MIAAPWAYAALAEVRLRDALAAVSAWVAAMAKVVASALLDILYALPVALTIIALHRAHAASVSLQPLVIGAKSAKEVALLERQYDQAMAMMLIAALGVTALSVIRLSIAIVQARRGQ